MGAGKILSIFAGILNLVATFVLCWFIYNDMGTLYYGYGVGLVKRIQLMFTLPENYSIVWGIHVYLVFIFACFLILFLISGILQLIGAKSRAVAIIGSLLPLIIGVIIILYSFGVIAPEWVVYSFGDTVSLIEGIIPFNYAFTGRPESIGTYLLLISGVLGLLSGFMSRKNY